MKIPILLCLAAFGTCAPHDVEKRSPDDDDYYFYIPPRAGGGLSSPRYVVPSFRRVSIPRLSYPRGYFLEVDYDDRRKREATHPETRQKRSADFDFDDDDFLFYQPVAKGLTTYSTALRPTFAQGYVPGRQVYYYTDDDLFDRRKKRSADFDDDDFYYFTAPRVTSYAAATTYAVANPPVVANPLYYYDFDDKK